MINIPIALWTKYGSVLAKKSVPAAAHNIYKKQFKNASKELVWQFFFSAKTLTLVPESGEYRSSPRDACAEGDQGSGQEGADHEMGGITYLPALLCRTPAPGQLRYPHHSGTAGAHGCEGSADLHSYYSEQDYERGEESA